MAQQRRLVDINDPVKILNCALLASWNAGTDRCCEPTVCSMNIYVHRQGRYLHSTDVHLHRQLGYIRTQCRYASTHTDSLEIHSEFDKIYYHRKSWIWKDNTIPVYVK